MCCNLILWWLCVSPVIGRWAEYNTPPLRTGDHSSTNQQQRWSHQESWAAPLGQSAPYRRLRQKTKIGKGIKKFPELRRHTSCHPSLLLGSVPFPAPSMHCSVAPVPTSQSPIILLWQKEQPMSTQKEWLFHLPQMLSLIQITCQF